MINILQYAALVISTGALIMSIATFLRAGKWRDSEEAKALGNRLSNVESRVDKHEVKFENIATKTDVARVEADVRAVGKEIGKVDAAVTRIESFLMEHSKS